jgi:hypothetical protein
MYIFRKEYGQTLSFVRTKTLFYMDEIDVHFNKKLDDCLLRDDATSMFT